MKETKEEVLQAFVKFATSIIDLFNQNSEDKITKEDLINELQKPESENG